MQEWIIIASADLNWGIGFRNRLLARIPEDMKHVSEKTKGKVIVMGRKTLESFPGGRPLPDRTNVVLTGSRAFSGNGATIVHDMAELMDALKDYQGEIYIFGGESVYRQLLPYCTRAFITRFFASFEADAYLPDFDALPGWKLSDRSEQLTSKTGLSYQFLEYRKG